MYLLLGYMSNIFLSLSLSLSLEELNNNLMLALDEKSTKVFLMYPANYMTTHPIVGDILRNLIPDQNGVPINQQIDNPKAMQGKYLTLTFLCVFRVEYIFLACQNSGSFSGVVQKM